MNRRFPEPRSVSSAYLVVARFDALPANVYFIFRTNSRNTQLVASRRLKSLGLKGNVTSVVPFEVDAEVSVKIEKRVISKLPPFPFGKAKLVKCSLDMIQRVISDEFSTEPKQVALRFKVLERQLCALEEVISSLKAENARLSKQKDELSEDLRISRLRDDGTRKDMRALRKELNEARRTVALLEHENERLKEYRDEYDVDEEDRDGDGDGDDDNRD